MLMKPIEMAMDPNTYVNIEFRNVKVPNLSIVQNFNKLVRFEFLLQKDGILFPRDDMKDILTAWLHDDIGECPIDFEFQIIV